MSRLSVSKRFMKGFSEYKDILLHPQKRGVIPPKKVNTAWNGSGTAFLNCIPKWEGFFLADFSLQTLLTGAKNLTP